MISDTTLVSRAFIYILFFSLCSPHSHQIAILFRSDMLIHVSGYRKNLAKLIICYLLTVNNLDPKYSDDDYLGKFVGMLSLRHLHVTHLIDPYSILEHGKYSIL